MPIPQEQSTKEARLNQLKGELNTKWIMAVMFIPSSIFLALNHPDFVKESEAFEGRRAEVFLEAKASALQSCFAEQARKNFGIAAKDGVNMVFIKPSIDDPEIIACADDRAAESVQQKQKGINTLVAIGGIGGPLAFACGLYSVLTIGSKRRKIKELENAPS